jgi:hypothetical protein
MNLLMSVAEADKGGIGGARLPGLDGSGKIGVDEFLGFGQINGSFNIRSVSCLCNASHGMFKRIGSLLILVNDRLLFLQDCYQVGGDLTGENILNGYLMDWLARRETLARPSQCDGHAG